MTDTPTPSRARESESVGFVSCSPLSKLESEEFELEGDIMPLVGASESKLICFEVFMP